MLLRILKIYIGIIVAPGANVKALHKKLKIRKKSPFRAILIDTIGLNQYSRTTALTSPISSASVPSMGS